MDLSSRLSNVKERLREVTEKYEKLVEVTKPYLMALQHFPDKVKEFFEGCSRKRNEPRKEKLRSRHENRKRETIGQGKRPFDGCKW